MIGAFIALLLLIVAGIFSIDTVARLTAERRVRAATGMETKIGKFSVGLASGNVHIENFVMKNSAEFGGESFVEMPELYIEYDREALRAGKLRLKLVRINIASIHVIENADGKRNIDDLQKHPAKPKSSKTSTNKNENPFMFDGIDALEITLRKTRFTNLRDPKQNMETDFGIQNELFRNLKTETDFQTAAAVLAIKAGAAFLLNGGNLRDLSEPAKLLKQSSKAGTETKSILEDIAQPVIANPSGTNP